MSARPLALAPALALALALILSSCIHLRGEDSEIVGREAFSRVFPKFGEVSDAKHGREVWFAYGALSGVSGTPANGVTDAHYLEDETFILGMQLNIDLAPEGTFYEGWLEHPETGELWSLGHLVSRFGDVRHGLRFEGGEDLRALQKVFVTLEEDDGNEEPGLRVAEGTLKVVSR